MTPIDPLFAGLADSVAGAQSLEALTRPLLQLLETITGLESTYLTMIDEAAGTQHVVFARNSGALQVREDFSARYADTLCRRALQDAVGHTDDVSARWPDADAARARGITTYASAPVRIGNGALYGTLCAVSSQRRALSPEALKVLGMFATLIGQQLEREALVTQLRQANAQLVSQALMDSLTGLPNRRALQLELNRMLARRARDNLRLLVAFIDLDGFKAINDQHGHEVGDALLVSIGAGLAEGLRAGDLVARYGGDEFVVVAPAPQGADAITVREFQQLLSARSRVQVAIDVHSDDDHGPPPRMLTYPGASVGVTLTEAGERDMDAVLARADAAMYVVKRARGRMR